MRRTALVVLPALVLMAACADASDTADTSAGAMAGDTSGATMQAGDMVDPSAATAEQLMAAGADSAAAAAIVAGRPYQSMLDVDRALAASMDSTQRENLYARIWMPIDLNTASDQEILLIPNLGNRMLHEFKEYRPYTNMAQFRREIGKYVDEAEVARLEKYVTIRQ